MTDNRKSCNFIVQLMIGFFWSMPLVATTINFKYHISTDKALTQVTVKLCVGDRAIYGLRSTSRHSQKLLTWLSKEFQMHFASGNRIKFKQALKNQCIKYKIDLVAAEKMLARSLITRFGTDLLLSPSFWLFLPNNTSEKDQVRATLSLPKGMSFSTPWQKIAGDNDNRIHYRIKITPDNWSSLLAFGYFKIIKIKADNTNLRVALINELRFKTVNKIKLWLQAAVKAVTSAYGQFPVHNPQILVIPSSSSGQAVRFGQASQGGGHGIQFYVNPNRPIEEFLDDWIAAHELSHLFLPELDHEGTWFSEGVATYYQNILRARVGQLSKQQAWQEIYDGFLRGMQGMSSKNLRQATLNMYRDHSYMRIYWSGTAITLMADIELRIKTRGRLNLDKLLKKFNNCCSSQMTEWSLTDLFRKFDELANVPVFMPLYRRYAQSKKFPATTGLLTKLGVEVVKGKVTLKNAAALSEIRRRITENKKPGTP